VGGKVPAAPDGDMPQAQSPAARTDKGAV